MRLLVIGGTSFVGRHLVDAALAAGDDVTLANRGVTNAELFSELEHRSIDRESGDVASLSEGRWDATIDVTAYVPRHVGEMASVLGERAGRYVLVSTASVYDTAKLDERADEDAARCEPTHGTEEVTGDTYGPLKVACEDVAWADFGDHSLIVRPGLVAGPHDPTDRFTYWVRRLSTGEPLLVPRRPDQPVQVIDARDLAAFLRHVAAVGGDGPFNAVGDTHPLADFLRQVGAGVGNPDPTIVWADTAWLREHDAPHQPLTLDPGWDMDGLFRRSNDRARAHGLTVRPLAETASDTRAWDVDRGSPMLQGTPTTEQEAALLERWNARS